MSLLAVLDALRRLHAANGMLDSIRGHARTLQRAAQYNPRNSDTWDVFELRDARLTRILRDCQRARTRFNDLRRVGTSATNHSRQLRRLFGAWAETHAARGADSRQARASQLAFATEHLQWNEELLPLERSAETARVALRKYLKFYTQQMDLFGTLADIARRFVQLWPDQAAQAYSYMEQFDDIQNCCRAIIRSIRDGIGRAGTLRRNTERARAEYTAWLRWMANRRNVTRDLDRNRAPI